VKGIRSVKNGYGLMILTTPKGILTDKEARKELVGGEILFKIW
jgi:small subunit ribosomal protein S8